MKKKFISVLRAAAAYGFSFVWFLEVMEFEFGVWHLLSKHSEIYTMPPIFFTLVYFSDKAFCFCLGKHQTMIFQPLPAE
jgi:hypothetical protein